MIEPHPPDPAWPRYSTRPFPSYRFVPGKSPHPRRDPHGHSYGQPEPKLQPFHQKNGNGQTPTCTGSTSITMPTGGNATKSLNVFGMQRATTPNKGTSSKPSSSSPQPTSSDSSATNKLRRTLHAAGSHVFKICLNCIWESTWSLFLKQVGIFTPA